MKKSALIVLISCVIAIALWACCFLLHFNKNVISDKTYLMSVNFNDAYDENKVASVLKDSGAARVEVVKTKVQNSYLNKFVDDTGALIYFEPAAGTTAEEVFKKADEALGEVYFLKYQGVMEPVSAAFEAREMINYWPAAIALIVAVILAGVFFGWRSAVATLINIGITGAASFGCIALTRAPISSFTVGAVLASVVLALLFGLGFANTLRDNMRRVKVNHADEIFALTVKQERMHCLLLAVLAVVAGVLMLIMGNSLVAGFGISLMIGAVISALSGIFTLPALAQMFQKAE